jgi:preprotein translocase subunit SecD
MQIRLTWGSLVLLPTLAVGAHQTTLAADAAWALAAAVAVDRSVLSYQRFRRR